MFGLKFLKIHADNHLCERHADHHAGSLLMLAPAQVALQSSDSQLCIAPLGVCEPFLFPVNLAEIGPFEGCPLLGLSLCFSNYIEPERLVLYRFIE